MASFGNANGAGASSPFPLKKGRLGLALEISFNARKNSSGQFANLNISQIKSHPISIKHRQQENTYTAPADTASSGAESKLQISWWHQN